jgi:hypothetical protein
MLSCKDVLVSNHNILNGKNQKKVYISDASKIAASKRIDPALRQKWQLPYAIVLQYNRPVTFAVKSKISNGYGH